MTSRRPADIAAELREIDQFVPLGYVKPDALADELDALDRRWPTADDDVDVLLSALLLNVAPYIPEGARRDVERHANRLRAALDARGQT